MRNVTYGIGEMYRGVFIGAQVKNLQKYIPELSLSDVLRYGNNAPWSVQCFQVVFYNITCFLQGSCGSSSSGPRPRRKPRRRLRVRRRRRGRGQSRAPRAERPLAGGHVLPRHRGNDRRWSGEPLRTLEERQRKTKKKKSAWGHSESTSLVYLSITVIRDFLSQVKP